MKYWLVASALRLTAAEALECLGGNGTWRIQGCRCFTGVRRSVRSGRARKRGALDVLRALVREPAGLPAFLAECEEAAGRIGTWTGTWPSSGTALAPDRRRQRSAVPGRRVVEDLALALQASLLVRHSPPAVSDAFCALVSVRRADAPTARSRRAPRQNRSSTGPIRASR